MNSVKLMGRLVRDPELKFIAGSGKAVCSFTLAVDKKLSKQKKEEYKNSGYPTANFIPVKVWGKSGEFAANNTAKGLRVLVEGSWESSSYDAADGTKRYKNEVMAYNITPIDWPNSGGSSNESKNDDFANKGFDSDGFQAIEDDDDIPF